MIAKGLKCSGKVQGVFFRASTKSMADHLDVKGWVKNESDGSVSIHVEGEVQRVDEFVEWCHKGPDSAVVSHVDVRDEGVEGFSSFDIKR